MRALITDPKQLVQLLGEEGVLQVSAKNYSVQQSTKLYELPQREEKILFPVGYQTSFGDWLPQKMNFDQQHLLALLQQQQQKMQEMKEYHVCFQQQHPQFQSPPALENFWLAMLASPQYAIPPANHVGNMAPCTIATNTEQQQFAGLVSFPGFLDTKYPLSLTTPSRVGQLALHVPPISDARIVDSVTGLFARDTRQDYVKQDELSKLTEVTQPSLLQQLPPSFSALVKRRLPESTQQQESMENAKGTVKRAKIIVIKQTDPEPQPCCSTSESNVLSPEESVEQQPHPASRIKKLCNDKGIRSSGDVSKDYNNMINKKENDEDDEDLQYVDVETVDEKLDSKEQRRALVEFYRKVKSVRVSYRRDDLLVCHTCKERIQNSDSLILKHLYVHAEMMPFRCKMCGAGENQLDLIYAHIRNGHPNKDPLTTYETRRNMAQLTCLLQACFPRNVTKTKAAYSEVIDKICDVVKEKSLGKLTCMVCTKKISARKMSITRHAQTHLHYRCKDCGITMFGDTRIAEHSTKKHGIVNPQCSAHYDPCANTSDKTETALKNCFSNILNEIR